MGHLNVYQSFLFDKVRDHYKSGEGEVAVLGSTRNYARNRLERIYTEHENK